MTLTLINKSNRMKVIPLPHNIYCKALGKCVCETIANLKNKVASSLTIPAGEKIEEMPDAILSIPLITRLIRKGELEAKTTPVQPVNKAKSKKSKKRKRNRSAS